MADLIGPGIPGPHPGMDEAPSSGRVWWVWIFLAGMVAGGLLVVGIWTFYLSKDDAPNGGVKLTSEMEGYALDYIKKNHLLNATEHLVCYLDLTSHKATEAAILTSERMLYHHAPSTLVFPLGDIASVERTTDSLSIDYLIVTNRFGEVMKITIYDRDESDTFLHAIEATRKRFRAIEKGHI